MAEIRLSKLTKQFSVGLARLVDFLNSIGANVEMNPNAKVSDAYLPHIEAKFGEDLKLKKDSERVTIKLKEIIEMGATQSKDATNTSLDNGKVVKGSATEPRTPYPTQESQIITPKPVVKPQVNTDASEIIQLFSTDNAIGDMVSVDLTNGKTIQGCVKEINATSVVIEGADGKKIRLFDKLIGGWENIPSQNVIHEEVIIEPEEEIIEPEEEITKALQEGDPQTIRTDAPSVMSDNNVKSVEIRDAGNIFDECKRLLKLLFNGLHIDPVGVIDTNATISSINDIFLHANLDDGPRVRIPTEYFVGYLSQGVNVGTRVFCRPILKDGGLISNTTIQEFSYADLMRFIIRLCNNKDSNSLKHVLKIMWNMPKFATSEEFLRKIYRCISNPNEKNLNEICSIKSLVEPKSSAPIDEFESAIRNYQEFKQALDKENLLYNVNHSRLSTLIDDVKPIIDKYSEMYKLTPNATIQKVMATSMIAEYEGVRIRLFYQQIIDRDLLLNIRNNPEIQHDVVLQTYLHKNKGEIRASAILAPVSLSRAYELICNYSKEGNYYYLKKAIVALKNYLCNIVEKKEISTINKVSKYLNEIMNSNESVQIPNISIIFSEKAELFSVESKRLHREALIKVDSLRASGQDSEALEYLDKLIASNKLLPKHISALLLRKAQILATLDDRELAIEAYKDVIKYDEGIGKSEVNLSHLYTELARIQSQIPELREDAIKSAKAALKYRDNKIAQNLLDSIMSDSSSGEGKETLMISSEESSSINLASRMLDVDIKEHNYTDKAIIENNGKPTPTIAQRIFEEASQTDDVENYPLFLEAAKAFSELKIGSYEYLSYAKAVASYARLKGNYLLRTFRKEILTSTNVETSALTHLKDSAQSYYIESLSFWSYISVEDSESEDEEATFYDEVDKDVNRHSWENIVQEILANYLRLDVALFYAKDPSISVNVNSLFEASFTELFNKCIKSGSPELETIAFMTVIKIGSFSSAVWNDVVRMGGVTGLYGSFYKEKNRNRIFNLINEIEGIQISTNLQPKEFLREAFKAHSNTMESLEKKSEMILREPLSPYEVERLYNLWLGVDAYKRIFCHTENETKRRIDDILKVLRPYANRSDQERSDLLLQARDIIESEIAFIERNTTYYGRTIFFPLLTKWRREIRALQREKMASKLPCLNVMPDPPYIIEKEGKRTINLLIKNNGESTAEGFRLMANISSVSSDEQIEIERETIADIPINHKVSFIIELGNGIQDRAVDLNIKVQPLYLSSFIESTESSFTIEEEPATPLLFEDVIWDDGPVTPENLFFGRKELINKLLKHYTSVQKNKPYILYGLTRTGKSSIVKFLGEEITGKSVISNGKKLIVLHFSMDLDKADAREDAKEIWAFFIKTCLYDKLYEYAEKYNISLTEFTPRDNPRASDFDEFLIKLSRAGFYPFITMDEFSYMKSLMQMPRQKLRPAFLHQLRQYSFNGLASFMYVGTYDIKDLITNKEYGITGQLTHCIDYQLNEIDDISARGLMDVLGEKLIFTDDAKDLISSLSGNVPYFIQIICKNCGFYAVEHRRGHIGFPELEQVMDVLLGDRDEDDESVIKKLTINPFEDNQYSATDPEEVHAIISSIAYLNKNNKHNPRGVGIGELEKLWANYGISDYRPKIGSAITLLVEKKILEQYEDDGVPVYRITVDLFRRWWGNEYPDISLCLSSLLR